MGFLNSIFGGGQGGGMRFGDEMGDAYRQNIFAQMIADNPEYADYFAKNVTPSELKKLGISSVDELKQIGQNSGATSMQDYRDTEQGFGDLISQVGGMSGEIDYDPFQFTNRDISGVADEAYSGAQRGQEEAAQRGFAGALAQLGRNVSSRGFGPSSGFNLSGGSSLGRGLMQQFSDIGRDFGLRKAEAQTDLEKYMAQLEAQRQGQQAQENRFTADLQKYAKNFGLQKTGMQADLYGNQLATKEARGQRYNQPYSQAGQYWQQSEGTKYKKPSLFEKAVGGVGSLAKTAANVYTGGAAGGLW